MAHLPEGGADPREAHRGPVHGRDSEGPLVCQDGYLAVDARATPYPIEADEFELIYEPVAL